MKKFDKYDNELTRYLNLVLGYDISDIIGDIVGDITSADIPIDIPSGDISIDVDTPLGQIQVKLVKSNYQETIYIYRKIEDKLFGEYIIDLNELLVENKSSGLILEKREKGIILTEITHKYKPIDEDGESLRLFESEERRYVYHNHQLYDIGLYLWCFPIETSFGFVKEDYKKFQRLFPKHDSKIFMQIPEYARIDNNGSAFYGRFPLSINGDPFAHLYENIEEDRKLEIVNDLLHGKITSLSLKHLKNMIIWELTPNDYRNHMIAGFDVFSKYNFFWSPYKEKVGTINNITNEYIGPSLITLGKEYYEYIRDLISSTLQIDFSPSEIEHNDIEQLIKSYYSENKPK